MRAAAELTGETFPVAARLGGSLEMPNPALRGSIRTGLWPGMDYAACVIHLGLVRGAGRLGAACVAVVAGLRGGDAGVRARGLLECATGYASRSKRESGRRRSSPRLESSCAGVPGR